MTIFCADDYALSPGISAAIRELSSQNRLSATSAMVTTPYWSEEAIALRDFRGLVSVGLHLNLTEGRALTRNSLTDSAGEFQGLGTLIRRALTGRLDRRGISAEIRAQLDAFESRFGFQPDHIDGHQHCHVLPIIRDALLSECSSRYMKGSLLFRYPGSTVNQLMHSRESVVKASFIRCLSINYRRLVARHGFHANTSFSGFSEFHDPDTIKREVDRIASRHYPSGVSGNGHTLHMSMCHPAKIASGQSAEHVEHAEIRMHEYMVILHEARLPSALARPVRSANAGTIAWDDLCPAHYSPT